MMAKRINTDTFTNTTLAPGGAEQIKDITIPKRKHTTDMMAEDTVTALKLLNIRIDERAGNIIRADMSRVPISLIPKTTVTAVRRAMSILYIPVLTPVAAAKDSSKVTENIKL